MRVRQTIDGTPAETYILRGKATQTGQEKDFDDVKKAAHMRQL